MNLKLAYYKGFLILLLSSFLLWLPLIHTDKTCLRVWHISGYMTNGGVHLFDVIYNQWKLIFKILVILPLEDCIYSFLLDNVGFLIFLWLANTVLLFNCLGIFLARTSAKVWPFFPHLPELALALYLCLCRLGAFCLFAFKSKHLAYVPDWLVWYREMWFLKLSPTLALKFLGSREKREKTPLGKPIKCL